MYVYGTGAQWHLLFRYNVQTRQIYNQRGQVLDVKNNKDQEGEYVGTANPQTNRVQQRWAIKYVDQMKDVAKNGTGSRGFEINRPFYIISRLWMQRVITHNNNNHCYITTKTKNDKK